MFKRYGILFALLCLSQTAAGQDNDFSQCIAELQDRAQREQLPEWIIQDVIPALRQQPRVIQLDRKQPEFTRTFADYLYTRVTHARITQGRRLLEEYGPYLNELTHEYGVPGRYLLAFWGLETNYGGYMGKMPTLDSLATLACDQRRGKFFADEFIVALKLLDGHSLTPEEMRGSWAGAVGHTQFMPSSYSRHAVDGDGDGRINLWKSKKDALASSANFLADLGWKEEERWGREVLLPKSFPYSESGLSNKKPLSYWRNLGVKKANGLAIPDIEIEASILLPAGHKGPAFAVYNNFNVIMRWNRSESYALSVGHLADRIAGGGDLIRPPSTSEQALSRHVIEVMQNRLNELGFDAGVADGVMGSSTRAALRAFQDAAGLIADGYPDSDTLDAIRIASERSS